MFLSAEALGDGEFSIDAAKQIRRLDPDGKLRAKRSQTAVTNQAVSGVKNVSRGRKPNWRLVKWGGGLTLIGLLVWPLLLIGLPLLAIGFFVGLPD